MRKRIISFIIAFTLAAGLAAPCLGAEASRLKYTINDIYADYAVEADVKLTGSGSGYHAKVLLAAPKSAVSLGIQFDKGAIKPYTNKAVIIVENIHSNKKGGQEYYRPKKIRVRRNKFYHLMLTLEKDTGLIGVYFNRKLIATYRNKELRGKKVWPRVEGCARLKNDCVKATFRNIKVKTTDFDELDDFRAVKIDVTPHIHSRIHSKSHVVISGRLTGIKPWQDWDSAYYKVSGTVQYCDD